MNILEVLKEVATERILSGPDPKQEIWLSPYLMELAINAMVKNMGNPDGLTASTMSNCKLNYYGRVWNLVDHYEYTDGDVEKVMIKLIDRLI
jgi:hypothetical protein